MSLTAPINPFINHCSPIDWQDCIDKANQKRELAEELLDILAKELPMLHAQIQSAYQKNNIQDLGYYIHKLHGSCCYCGIPKLQQIVSSIDTHLHSLPKDGLDRYMKSLNIEVDNVLISIRNKDYL